MRVKSQRALANSRQPVMALAEINRLGRDHNPYRLRRDNHPCRANRWAMSTIRVAGVLLARRITTGPTEISTPSWDTAGSAGPGAITTSQNCDPRPKPDPSALAALRQLESCDATIP